MTERDPVEILAEEFIERYRRGERPAISEYVDRCPAEAERVRSTFPALVLMEDLAGSDYESFDDSKQAVAVGEDLPLEQLGEYRIIREIGRGGMGVVYEAEQLSLGRHVALKVLSRRALKNPKQIKRFEHEARAAARLHHTNIVPVFDVGAHDGILYYVMQFIQGASLDQVLDDVKRLRDIEPTAAHDEEHDWQISLSEVAASLHHEGGRQRPRTLAHAGSHTQISDGWESEFPSVAAEDDTGINRLGDTSTFSGRALLPGTTEASGRRPATYWESVARIGVQVADALAYANAQGVAHRDIKPSNLLLDTRGTVWITDFGLAKSREQEDLTNTGDFVGTLRYMAPERFAGTGETSLESDPRSDIYSLGLTLYEMLAFRPAFDESDRHRLMRQVMNGEPVRLRKLNPEVPRDLETIVHKAIERDPNHRLQTAADLAADLRRFLDDEPIRARQVRLPERAYRWCRRNPATSLTTLAALVVVAATIAAAFVAISGERDRYERLAQHNKNLADQNEQLAIDERGARQQAERAAVAERELKEVAEKHRAEAEQTAAERQAVTDFLTRDVLASSQPDIAIERSLGAAPTLTMRQVLDWAAGSVDNAFPENPRTQAAVRSTIGRAYNSLGEYASAEEQLRRALEQQRKLLGEDHPDTLVTWNGLTISLNEQGHSAESREQQEQIVRKLTELYGPEHIQTLIATANLATSHYRQGSLAEARRLLETALDGLRESVGGHHVQTIRTLIALAAVMHASARYEEAHALLEEAAENRRLTPLADAHPLTLAILTNRAVNLLELGRPREAEQQARRVYTVQQHALGPNHPHTLTTLGNIARALDGQGKPAEAQPLHERVLDERTRLLGDDHPETLAAQSDLAANLLRQQRYDESVRLYTELVATRERTLGREHVETLRAMHDLASAYRAQGDLAVAHQEFSRVIELAEQVFGREHLLTLRFRRSRAENQALQGMTAEAEQEYQNVLAILREHHGSGNRATLQTSQELAGVLLRQDKHEQAAEILRAALAAADGTEVRPHWTLAAVQSLLGEALTRQREYAAAEQMLLAAHRRLATLPLVPPYELRQTLSRLAKLYELWTEPDHTQEAARWRAELEHFGPASGPPPPVDE